MCWLLLAVWPCSGEPQTAPTGGARVRGRPAVPGLRALVAVPWVAMPWGCAWAGGGARFFANVGYRWFLAVKTSSGPLLPLLAARTRASLA